MWYNDGYVKWLGEGPGVGDTGLASGLNFQVSTTGLFGFPCPNYVTLKSMSMSGASVTYATSQAELVSGPGIGTPV
jgi:hypothetical protein